MNKQAHDQLTKARANMIIDQPFFGTLALRLKFVESLAVKTLEVDGKSIFYNPDFVLTMSLEVTKAAVAHEVMHCVLDHMSRLGGRQPAKWNMAADYVVNPILKDAGFRLGDDWLYNPMYAGMSADHVYTLLPDSPGGGALDELKPSTDHTETTKLDWKLATTQAAEAAKKQGRLPGSLQRFVDEAIGNRVDWRAHLWSFATEISKDDYSWLRPNRRYLSQGLYLPSLYSESMGTLAVFIDTSGSVDIPTLNAFTAEIRAMREALQPEQTYVLFADAAVQRVDVFKKEDELVIEPKGGGGTDFRPAFQWIKDNDVIPACAVYLTDMYGHFPEEPAPYPVLWCATSEEIAPWGETVRVEM